MLYIFHNIVIKYNSSFLLTAREYKECGDTIKGPCIKMICSGATANLYGSS